MGASTTSTDIGIDHGTLREIYRQMSRIHEVGKAIQAVRPDAVFQLGRAGMGKREPKEIGFHAIRRGNIPGIHEVIVSNDNQAITLRHEVYDRALFADGALSAARYLQGKAPGLYDMTNIIRD